MSLAVENILGIIDRDGEEELMLDLSSFSCAVNDEIQTFLTDKAVEFAKKKMSITYLVSDTEDGEMLGYFTLAHKVLETTPYFTNCFGTPVHQIVIDAFLHFNAQIVVTGRRMIVKV